MYLRCAPVLALLALAGCDRGPPDPRLALCLHAVRQTATEPRSVELAHFKATPPDVAQAKRGPSTAILEFGAENSYSAKLGGTAVCAYAPHPMPEHKGGFLLTSAVIGTITLTDQQIAEANSLDGSARGVVEAITAAEMVLEKAKAAPEAK